MPEEISYKVRSNLEALNASVLHAALVAMVDETTEAATTFLRADRAMHSRTGLTAAHVRSEKASQIADIIEAKLGITEVLEKDVRPTGGRYEHSQAPMFVDGGTHTPIFSPRGKTMWNRSEGIFGRMTVRGQEGQHFMAKTYAEAQALLHEDKQISLALKVMDADAAALKAAIEAE